MPRTLFAVRSHVAALTARAGLTAVLVAAPAFVAPAQTEGGAPASAVTIVDAAGGDIDASGVNVVVRGNAEDIRAAGALINIEATSTGSVRAAGAQVMISGSTAGRVQAAGASVTLRAPVGGNAHVAGAVVNVDSAVTGRLRAAGASVTLGPATDVTGKLQAAGAVVSFAGHAASDADFAGGAVTISGRLDRNVTIYGRSVVIAPQAVISGNLVVRSFTDPVIEPGATVSGEIRREPMVNWWSPSRWMWRGALATLMVVGTFLTGIVLMLIGRRAFEDAVINAQHRPLTSILIGILTVIILPVIAVVLMATVVGITLGVALLLLLPLLFVAGHAAAAAGVGGWIVNRSSASRSVALLLLLALIGAIVITLISFVPFVGVWLVVAALVLGVGSFTRTILSRIRKPLAAAP